MSVYRYPDRAIELLQRVLATAWYDQDSMALELVVSIERLDDYVAERVRMPLDRQLVLAKFVIEKLPSLARHGHRLLGQIRAAAAFHEGTTATHADAPPIPYH